MTRRRIALATIIAGSFVGLAVLLLPHAAPKPAAPGINRPIMALLGTTFKAENIAASGTITAGGNAVVATPACSASQVPLWNGSAWTCSSSPGGTISHDTTLAGTGSAGSPIGLANPLSLIATQLNISPALDLGIIGWSAGQGSVLNTWSPTGLGTKTQIWVDASDNQGTMITGICSRTACGSAKNFGRGDVLKVCNGNAPLDDGVVMLSNEDARTPNTLDQIILPNSGRPGQGVQMTYAIPPGGCATVVYDEYDHVTAPGVLRWHIDDSNSRQPNITAGYLGMFPDAIANGMHGTYDNFRPGNAATALSGPQGYATTVAVASNGQVLPGGNTTSTITVASTAGFTGPGGQTTYIPITITHAATVYSFACSGLTSTTFTGCIGAAVTISTGDSVQGGLCDAGTTCSWDEYSNWTIQGTDGSTVILRGLYFGGNAKPTGEGPLKTLCNAGPGLLQLNHLDAGSTSNMQMAFYTGAAVTLQVRQCITLWHSTLYQGVWLEYGSLPLTATAPITITNGNAAYAITPPGACSLGQALETQTSTGVTTCGGVGGALLAVQKFTAAGTATYTPTTGTKHVVLEAIGGGASGASCAGAGTGVCGSGGGASGAYIRKYIDCGGTCTGSGANGVTVGAAGAAPTSGANNGNAGTDTTITVNAVLYTVRGGSSGGSNLAQTCTSSTSGVSAAGGRLALTSTSADLNIESQSGGNGVTTGTVGESGAGANGFWGQGGIGEVSPQGGAFASHGFGAGGAGSFCTTVNEPGGAGIAGAVIVWEYN